MRRPSRNNRRCGPGSLGWESLLSVAAISFCAATPACFGEIGGGGKGKPGPPDHSLGEAPMHRLNRVEYDNTVADIFGVTGSPSQNWPADASDSGFDNDVSGQGATSDLVEQIMRSAENVADDAVTRLDDLLPCSTEQGDAAACGGAFIDLYGRRAYRRALSTEERDRLTGILVWGLGRGDLKSSVRLVIIGMLQAPAFLYRPELGGPLGAGSAGTGTAQGVALDDHEIATRLSYMLTASAPDDALLDASDSGTLHTSEQIKQQADRLLDSAAGRKNLGRFFRQWLPFTRLASAVKDAAQFPEFDDGMKTAMAEGTTDFVEHVIFDSNDGSLRELLTADYAFVNAKTAPLYGLDGSAYGADFVMTPLNEPRAGILTQVGMMAALSDNYQSSPVARGKFIYQGLLCQAVGAPPANLPQAGAPPPPDPSKTTRERFAEHRDNPACAGCHNLMDPLGFALEHYDAIGRYRSSEAGQAIDATGTVALDGVDVSFDGAVELAGHLADSDLARTCFARKWFTFGFGRGDVTQDEATLRAVSDAFGDGSVPLREVLISLTQTYAFTHRPAVSIEECAP